ncbi:glutathione S-transferase theta-2 isoform X1 [Callorhinchus milii]|uniref:glutathione S-transferase theta-2 isoform X1 n=1 Tax=Callorhinchus milii TaxID=7868 RepID=UPI001C3F6866|nr:glutathione S-transferase theta-2 isoform X1 [Callorhinchus milii]
MQTLCRAAGTLVASMSRRPVEVYFDLLSQPSRAVLIFLRAAGIPHVERPVALRKGEQNSPEFGRLNPMRKVPVIVDNGFVLTESVAILKYLASTYDVPQNWYPRDPQRRAKVDEYMAWQHLNTRMNTAKVFIFEVLIPQMTSQPVDDQKVSKALKDLEGTLDMLETMFLKDKPFLCGDDLTLADLLAICELMQPLGGDRDVLKERPKLASWRSRVQSALGKTFEDVHAIVYRLRNKSRL